MHDGFGRCTLDALALNIPTKLRPLEVKGDNGRPATLHGK